MPPTLRITRLKFAAGPRPGDPPLDLVLGSNLVLVGPNNSGKSLALREIHAWCQGQDNARRVVSDIEVDLPTDPDEGLGLLKELEVPAPPGSVPVPGRFWINRIGFVPGGGGATPEMQEADVRTQISGRNLLWLRGIFTSFFTIKLDGRTRFSLAEPQPTGDLQLAPQNHLWALFKDDTSREEVRRLTADAFGLHFVIDPTQMQTFRIRMSPKPPATSEEEQSLSAAGRNFHSRATMMNEMSDGVQAFVGLISAVMSLRHRIVLVDEPDAFLHPPLARRLGSNLARIARARGATLVTATHSSGFLVGSLEAAPDSTVVRLTFESGSATARTLSSAQLSDMIRDPLLRSTGVMQALFHRSAVITEADTDRAFYDEINRRLSSATRGLPDALFLNAQNKGTLRRLVAPLRLIGIPAAAIADLDMLEGAGEFGAILEACQVPTTERARFEAERAAVIAAFGTLQPTTGPNRPIKTKGVAALNGNAKAQVDKLVADLETYGLFLVPVGELEGWLPSLGARGEGAQWLIDMFTRMGADEAAAGYVAPVADDVWAFEDRIAVWAANPQRLGLS